MNAERAPVEERRRLVTLVGVPSALVIVVALVLIVPAWVRVLARPVRRQLIDQFLHLSAVAYLATLLIAAPMTVVLAVSIARTHRRAPLLAKLLLGSVSCLAGLVLVEAMAATWLGWVHRAPSLPDRPLAARPEPIAFQPATKRAGSELEKSVRIAVIGGSTAEGFPYHPWLSIGQIVTWQLARALPEKQFDLNVLAQGGADLEQMYRKLAKLEQWPDVLIIYSGHNEFQARYEWSRTLRPAKTASDRGDVLIDRLAMISPLCRMIDEALHDNRLDEPPRVTARPILDWPMCSPAEYAEILAQFSQRLEAIVAHCNQMGTLPVLIIPAANDAGFEPNRSALPESVSASERIALTRLLKAARHERDSARAMALYRSIVTLQPQLAEAHFQLGRLLESAGDGSAARHHFTMARDADRVPLRCPTVFQNVYRGIAARHDCILIDASQVLGTLTASGLLNDELFHDAQHPNLRSYVALSQAVLHALRHRNALGWTGGSAPIVDRVECARHFGMDAHRWWTVCERTSEVYRWLAIVRFDPSERLARSQRYAAAAQKVAEGVAPEDAGIVGLGVRSLPRPGA